MVQAPSDQGESQEFMNKDPQVERTGSQFMVREGWGGHLSVFPFDPYFFFKKIRFIFKLVQMIFSLDLFHGGDRGATSCVACKTCVVIAGILRTKEDKSPPGVIQKPK